MVEIDLVTLGLAGTMVLVLVILSYLVHLMQVLVNQQKKTNKLKRKLMKYMDESIKDKKP
jgi:Na+-transporting methylmalonyl-CoA/oxaloacetate decarboxylase gamma subunit